MLTGIIESNPEFQCVSCKRVHCFLCPDTRITGEVCEHLQEIKTTRREMAEQAIRRQREKIPETLREIDRRTKMCPRAGCRSRIERAGGCAHFKCQNCETEFCWCCKVIWPSGQALHLDTCRLSPRRTVSKSALDTSNYTTGWDVDPGYDTALDNGLGIPAYYL